jgi:hypothetical protein
MGKNKNKAERVRLTSIQIPRHPQERRRKKSRVAKGNNPMIHLYISSIITSSFLPNFPLFLFKSFFSLAFL